MAEVQYPSNSNKSKQEQLQKQSSKLISGNVSGDVGVQKSVGRRLLEEMFAKDIKAALTEFFWKRFLPSVKSTALNGIHGAINVAAGWIGSSNGTTGSYTNYSNSYPGQYVNYSNQSNSNYQQITGKSYPSASDLKFNGPDPGKNLEDASTILRHLKDAIEDCGYVTVNTLYGWLGRSCDYTWNNYGWINVDSAKIIDHGDGTYSLKLPKASPIDKN